MISNLTVPVLNRYDLLERMCESIDYPVGHLLIIDNGGGIESWDTPDMVEKLTVLPMPSNVGVAASWNLGIKLFYDHDVFFFASNDMVFEPGGLARLGEAERGAVTLSDQHPHFHTFAVGVDVVKLVGLFDEAFFPAYCEDVDFLWRCERAGVPVKKWRIPTRHDNSSTIGSSPSFRAQNNVTHSENLALMSWKRANMRSEALPFDVMRWRRQAWR